MMLDRLVMLGYHEVMNTHKLVPNKLAAEMAAQQVAAFDADLVRLDDQIRTIEAKKVAIKVLRDGLAAIVAANQEPEKAVSEPTPQSEMPAETVETQSTSTGALPDLNLKSTQSTTNGHLNRASNTGFSSVVREIVRQHPKGVRAQDVVAELQRTGRSNLYSGNTPFSTRVGNELYRLMKNETLQRRNGRYFCSQDSLLD